MQRPRQIIRCMHINATFSCILPHCALGLKRNLLWDSFSHCATRISASPRRKPCKGREALEPEKTGNLISHETGVRRSGKKMHRHSILSRPIVNDLPSREKLHLVCFRQHVCTWLLPRRLAKFGRRGYLKPIFLCSSIGAELCGAISLE